MNKLKALFPNKDQLLLCALCGVLSALGFPKWNLWPCGWVFLIPLLHAMRGSGAREGYKLAFWAGIFGNFLQLYWITWTISDYTAVPVAIAALVTLGLAALVSLFWGLFGAALCWLRPRVGLPLPLLAAATWTVSEALRTPMIRFNWNKLGVLWLEHDFLVQFADLVGVYGLSFLIVLANGALYEIFALRYRRRRGEEVTTDESRAKAAFPTVVAMIVGSVFLYGFARYNGMESKMQSGEPLLRAALVQGNIEQRMKWDPEWEEEILRTYEDLTREAVKDARKDGGKLDVVIWPEAAVPFFPVDEDAPGWRLRRLVDETGVPLLFGAPHYEAGRYYNSAFLMSPGTETMQRYDKNMLVPFGEFVPFRSLLFFIDKITEGGGDFTPGTGARTLALGGAKIGTLICYEGIFPELVRDFERGGADVLANITNDAWFGPTSAPYQHLAAVRMRAIETRAFVLRAANTGVTTLIDPLGVARDQTQLNERAFRIVEAGADLSETFYEKHGDFMVGLSALGLIFAFAWSMWRGRKPAAGSQP